MMNESRLEYLWKLFFEGSIHPEERQELMQWIIRSESESSVASQIQNELDRINSGSTKITSRLSAAEADMLFQAVVNTKQPAKVASITTRWSQRMRWIAAAVFILAVAGSVLVFFNNDRSPVSKNEVAVETKKDILPGKDGAILTLADGRQIVLDTATNGSLAVQGGTKIIKLNGHLSYSKPTASSGVVYNTITTPKGRQYQLELADGSRIWLNAASSLRFPSAFVGSDRTVELTGEGYFEVAHDAAKPFHVKVKDMDVKVLGTHFDINSYDDEPLAKTTLLEGRVVVKNPSSILYLNPGQQAKEKGTQLQVENDVDLDEVMAWKNGYFSFNNADIKTVMRQLSRWYDIDVVYDGDNAETFSGKIDRKLSLRDLLDGLGQTKVHYKIEDGGKLVILP